MHSIIRVSKIKSRSQATSAMEHNLRLRKQANIDNVRSKLNKCLFDNLKIDNTKASSFQERLSEKYSNLGIKERKDNVFCLEFELSASPEFWFGHIPSWNIDLWNSLSMDNPQDKKIIREFWNKIDPEKVNKWRSAQVDLAKKEWGEALERLDFHLDEKTPHMHVLVNTVQKTVKTYKNRYGTTEKETYSLNARRFNPAYLTGLQDRYALKNNIFGLKRGLKGSKRAHKKLKYYYEEKAKSTLELIMENERLIDVNNKAKSMFPKLRETIIDCFNTIQVLSEILEGKELTKEERNILTGIEATIPKTSNKKKMN